MSALDSELLEILVCPETRQSVRMADAAVLARVNQAISEGVLKNRGGNRVQAPLDSGLVRDDGRVLYPVRDDIPVMLLDEAIDIDGLDASMTGDSSTP